ncbi:MAG: hypothetical protein QW429_05765 [Thermoprotei archaeon]
MSGQSEGGNSGIAGTPTGSVSPTLLGVVKASDRRWSVTLKDVTANSFRIEVTYFPFDNWGNNQTVYMDVWLTAKRAKLKLVENRDNWNGSGLYANFTQFIDRALGEKLVSAVQNIIGETDQDEKEYQLLQLGLKMRKAFFEGDDVEF